MRRHRQIDRLVWAQTGAGSVATPWFPLPRARYTVFARYDPRDAVRSFRLVDEHARSLPDWGSIPAPAGDVLAPIVQADLARGRYQVDIDTATPTCAWSIQIVLNSMRSWRGPPRPWRASSPPPSAMTIDGNGPPYIRVPATGRYLISWRVGPAGDRPPIAPYSLRLRAADGHAVELGVATATGDKRVDGAFLGAGTWTVEMQTQVDWELMVAPMVGPVGGGAVGFYNDSGNTAPPPAHRSIRA